MAETEHGDLDRFVCAADDITVHRKAGGKTAAIIRPDGDREEAPVTTEAMRKGKPSKGTKKDKRLEENDYGSEGHFRAGVVLTGWDGSALTAESCAGADPGDGPDRFFLPHHDPDGLLNAEGLHAAVQDLGTLSGHAPQAVAHAKAHLRSHYRALGEDVPDVLRATALETAVFGVETGYETTSWGDMKDCPPGMTMDPDTGKCVKSPKSKGDKGEQPKPYATETAEADTAPWRGPLTVEGIETGDGREFDAGALTWADLPLPLRWNRVDSHGGETRTEAVNVGRIDKIWREDNGLVMGEGVLDLSDDDGKKVYSKIKGKHLRGVSVDVDSIKDADMELIWPEAPEGETEGDEFARMFAAPEKVVFHRGRIRAATLVDIPAFAEAYVALLDGDGAIVAGGEPTGAQRAYFAVRERTASVRAPEHPPVDWFRNPDLSVPTGITVGADGRVYGHAALWGTCHIGQTGLCVTPPHEEDHPYFMTGSVFCTGDTLTSVGQITVDTGHADISLGHRAASAHYDDTGAAVADVAVGNDAHGIWVAGAVRASATEEQVHALRASGQVSGDWRNVGGALRLVGLLAVNVPGFPVPKIRAKYTGGHQFALVAAGMPNLTEQLTDDEIDQLAYRRVMEKIAMRVHGKE